MRIGDICTRTVVTCSRQTTAREAARLMREHHVGDLVVVDARDDAPPVPVGMVTDRDLVLRVLAADHDADEVRVGSLMDRDIVTATPAETVYDAIWHLRSRGVRRLPVVDAHGALVGLLCVDDVLKFMAAELTALAGIGPRGLRREGSDGIAPSSDDESTR